MLQNIILLCLMFFTMIGGSFPAFKFVVPANCLCEIKDDVCEVENILDDIVSIIEAIDLETCPVTLLYQSGVPYTLTASGRYCLAEDLIADAAAVTINGSGITLDLNSHTIFVNADNVTGIAVYGGSNELPNSDIVIKNGTLLDNHGFGSTGIWLGADGNQVNNVRIEDLAVNNLDTGIYIAGAVGTVINNVSLRRGTFEVQCEQDSATTITNSNFLDSCYGLTYCESSNMIVRDCSFASLNAGVVSGDCEFGLYAAEFSRCTALSCFGTGFSFIGANGLVVRDCTASGNCGHGFEVSGSSFDVLFRDCVASDNGGQDCGVEYAHGFHMYDSINISLYNCFAQNNQNDGFHAYDSSVVLARNCTATNNGVYGFRDNTLANQYYANYACNNTINYDATIIASGLVTSPNNMRGVHNVDCMDSDLDQLAEVESIVENMSDLVNAVCSCSLITEIVTEIDEQLFALSSAVDAIAVAEKSDDCSVTLVFDNPAGQILSNPGRYCLAEDINSTGTNTGSLMITGNSIILDLNGHTVYGSLTFDGIRIMGISGDSPIYDVTVQNGSVADAITDRSGLYAQYVNGLQLEDVSCTNCQVGVALLNVDGVVMNNVISSKNGGRGLYLSEVNNLLAQSCLFNENFLGIEVVDGRLSNSEFVNCSVNFSGLSGFIVLAEMTNVVLRDCSANNNNGTGFFISISNDVCLYNCYAASNGGNGFDVFDATVLVRNCTAINNGSHGFFDNGLNYYFYAVPNQYYANYACNNAGGNYSGIIMAPVTSPANARDFSNVDCSNSAVDQIAAILGCLTC